MSARYPFSSNYLRGVQRSLVKRLPDKATNLKEQPKIVLYEFREPVMLRRNTQSDQIMDTVIYLLARTPEMRQFISAFASCFIIKEPISHGFDRSGR